MTGAYATTRWGWVGLLSRMSSIRWLKPLPGGFPPPASPVFMVPAIIVAIVFRALGPLGRIVLAIIILGIVIGLLIYTPAFVINSFRSKRRVQLAPWFGQHPLSAKILLVVLGVVVAVVIAIARAHL